jgi:hypothetical protein
METKLVYLKNLIIFSELQDLSSDGVKVEGGFYPLLR